MMSSENSSGGRQAGSTRIVKKLGKFELGDLVSSYGCEQGRPYMPGVGEIVTIQPGEERPYVCKHNNKLYYFKGKEISIHDFL